MPGVLSFPFRFTANGTAATVEQDTPEQDAELVGALVMTRLGERDLVPGFGIPDPTFTDLDVAALTGAAEVFGPDVTITDVRVQITGPGTQDVTVEFE